MRELLIENISMFSRMFCGKMIYVVTTYYWQSKDKSQWQFYDIASATEFIGKLTRERMHHSCASLYVNSVN